MSDGLKQTYELVKDAPPAMTWDTYRTWLEDQWGLLLETGDKDDEKVFHRFLEHHPCLVPGGDGTGESFGGHHGAFVEAVYTEALLPEPSRRYPDFMWITKNSELLIPVLIELEAPGKRIWRASDNQAAEPYTQALSQILEWQQIFGKPASLLQWEQFYGIPGRLNDHKFAPRYLLIYGRRNEKEQRRAADSTPPVPTVDRQETRSWDRLEPLERSRNAATFRKPSSGRAHVVAIQPTLQFGPGFAPTLLAADGWEAAIDNCALLTDDRRSFLHSRVPYWREWAQNRDRGVRRYSDRE